MMSFEHLGIHSKDPESLSKWYQDTLEMEITRKLEKSGRPPIYFLKSRKGGFEIEILPTTEEREEEKELKKPGYSHIGVVVDDFEKVKSQLESKGVELYGVRDTSNGWRIGYFEDPEDNILEIVQR